MTILSKSLLTAAVISFLAGLAFVTGWIGVSDVVALYIALPLGAVFFGLFLILQMLEKETAAFDADQRRSEEADKDKAPKGRTAHEQPESTKGS